MLLISGGSFIYIGTENYFFLLLLSLAFILDSVTVWTLQAYFVCPATSFVCLATLQLDVTCYMNYCFGTVQHLLFTDINTLVSVKKEMAMIILFIGTGRSER